jgi:hypothetical protein
MFPVYGVLKSPSYTSMAWKSFVSTDIHGRNSRTTLVPVPSLKLWSRLYLCCKYRMNCAMQASAFKHLHIHKNGDLWHIHKRTYFVLGYVVPIGCINSGLPATAPSAQKWNNTSSSLAAFIFYFTAHRRPQDLKRFKGSVLCSWLACGHL